MMQKDEKKNVLDILNNVIKSYSNIKRKEY